VPAARAGERREIVVLAACLTASALLLVFGSRLDTIALARAEAILLWPAVQTRAFLESVFAARAQNELLRIELTRLRAERTQMLRAGAENERLRRTLGFAAAQGPVVTPARVVAAAGEPWPLVYHLSAGSERGIRVGQAVVAPEGLVGRIASVASGHATVALLTDPSLAVACEVLPSGVRGVARFRAEERPGLYLLHVPLTDTVRIGEIVATSGLSQVVPAGLLVGTVIAAGRDPGGLVQTIEIRPAAPLARLREVFVVIDVTRLEPWAHAADSLAASTASGRTAAADSLAPADSAGRAVR
jgi:rod shape-determining protein MreC